MNVENLLTITPNIAPFVAGLLNAAARYRIDTPLRQSHWLAQLAHESAGFRVLEENLNYGANALVRTWPNRFTPASAAAAARNPRKIANIVYADRLGNGDSESGDGWTFRGRGLIQLTGAENYATYSRLVFCDDRMVADPDLATNPDTAASIAGAYWHKKNLNLLADTDNIEYITRRINGGVIGLDSRRAWLVKTKEALNV